MSKSKLIHTISESKNIFALEQKAIVLSFVKNVAFLLGHLADVFNFEYSRRNLLFLNVI